MHSLLYEEELYMHEYYVHTISMQPVLVVVVTLNNMLLHRIEPLVTFANTDIDGFWCPDPQRCPQIEEYLVGIICGTLPRLPMNAHIHKNYTTDSSSM